MAVSSCRSSDVDTDRQSPLGGWNFSLFKALKQGPRLSGVRISLIARLRRASNLCAHLQTVFTEWEPDAKEDSHSLAAMFPSSTVDKSKDASERLDLESTQSAHKQGTHSCSVTLMTRKCPRWLLWACNNWTSSKALWRSLILRGKMVQCTCPSSPLESRLTSLQ